MSALVSPDEIERIVGVDRHVSQHFARAVSAEQTVYILHSRLCKQSGVDLRECPFSLALDTHRNHSWYDPRHFVADGLDWPDAGKVTSTRPSRPSGCRLPRHGSGPRSAALRFMTTPPHRSTPDRRGPSPPPSPDPPDRGVHPAAAADSQPARR